MRTCPAMIMAWARWRVGARPRSTRSTSMRDCFAFMNSRDEIRSSTERRQNRGGAEQENHANDQAVGGGERGSDAHHAFARGAHGENADGGGGHERVHQQQAGEKHREAEESARDAAKICGEKKNEELAGCFRAEPVNHTDEKHGFLCVVPVGDGGTLDGFAVKELANRPTCPAKRVDQN